MKEKIILIVGVIAFAIILVFASEAMKNPEINNQINNSNTNDEETSNSNKVNDSENFNSNESNVNVEISDDENRIIYANESTFEAEVLNSDKVVLVDFYADWCYPCRMLAPTLEKIAKENDDVKIVKVNVDENEKLAIEYGATSIPLLVAIENGQEKDRLVGAVPESEILRVLNGQ